MKEFMMSNKKYEFVDWDTIEHNGITLKRIRAIVAIGLTVSAGDLGGYIQSEENLSRIDDAWISGNARVFGDARVSDNAHVFGNASVFGDARVSGNAHVENDKSIFWATKVGKNNDSLTAFKNKDGKITLAHGCFFGSISEFKALLEEKHSERTKREYKLLIKVAKSRILGE